MPTFYAPMEGYSGSRVGETYFTTTGTPTYSSTYAQYGTTSGVFSANQAITRTVTGTTTWLQGYTKISAIAGNQGFWLGAIAPYNITGLVVRANAGGTTVTFAFANALYSIDYQNTSVTTHPVGAGSAWFRWQYRNGPSSSTYNIFTGTNINGASPNITATTTTSGGYFGANGGQVSFPSSYLNATTFTAYYDNLVTSNDQPPVADPSFIPHSSVGIINAI